MTDRGVNMNIDDMRVGDFLHLMDCMQEECCEHKNCNECRYIDFCYVDMPSIDSLGIRRTVEGYAEANGLLEHMRYIDDQKWIPVSEMLPDKDGRYLVQHDYGEISISDYADGWNCYRHSISKKVVRSFEMNSIVAWMPLPEPYRGEEV